MAIADLFDILVDQLIFGKYRNVVSVKYVSPEFRDSLNKIIEKFISLDRRNLRTFDENEERILSLIVALASKKHKRPLSYQK